MNDHSATALVDECFQLGNARFGGSARGNFLSACSGFPLGTDLRTPACGSFPFGPVMLLMVAEEVHTRLRITESHLPALRP